MINREKGKINELVYDLTIYNGGNSRYDLTIGLLGVFLEKASKINETTEYIRIIPFYRNTKLKKQIEFDDYMFFLSCRKYFNKMDLINHWKECMMTNYENLEDNERYEEMSPEKQQRAKILYPLCQTDDAKSFSKYIIDYKEYLNELLPKLFAIAIEEMNLTMDDFPFGYFCFEITSN